MNRQFIINNFGWGVGLWLFGYLLSIILFFFVPPSFIGWVLMPIGIFATLWVLQTRIKTQDLFQYFVIGAVWLLIAVLLDYVFIVRALNPADGYYKPAVYIYYALTLLLPVGFGIYRRKG